MNGPPPDLHTSPEFERRTPATALYLLLNLLWLGSLPLVFVGLLYGAFLLWGRGDFVHGAAWFCFPYIVHEGVHCAKKCCHHWIESREGRVPGFWFTEV